MDATRFRELCIQSYDAAERLTATTWRWDISMGCDDPFEVELGGYQTPITTDVMKSRVASWRPGERPPRYLKISTPCRRCKPCLKNRSRYWAARARQEIQSAHRTWFATLTLTPQEQYHAYCRAISKDPALVDLPADRQFAARVAAIGPEITRFTKRVRKSLRRSKALRTLLVAEPHKSGLPHFHMLLHESSPIHELRERHLRSQWRLGFSSFKLVDVEASYYVAKYLSKTAETRVRASQRYGQSIPDPFTLARQLASAGISPV